MGKDVLHHTMARHRTSFLIFRFPCRCSHPPRGDWLALQLQLPLHVRLRCRVKRGSERLYSRHGPAVLVVLTSNTAGRCLFTQPLSAPPIVLRCACPRSHRKSTRDGSEAQAAGTRAGGRRRAGLGRPIREQQRRTAPQQQLRLGAREAAPRRRAPQGMQGTSCRDLRSGIPAPCVAGAVCGSACWADQTRAAGGQQLDWDATLSGMCPLRPLQRVRDPASVARGSDPHRRAARGRDSSLYIYLAWGRGSTSQRRLHGLAAGSKQRWCTISSSTRLSGTGCLFPSSWPCS